MEIKELKSRKKETVMISDIPFLSFLSLGFDRWRNSEKEMKMEMERKGEMG